VIREIDTEYKLNH